MDRRTFLKSAALGTVVAGAAAKALASEKYFPAKVDQSLFETINRVKNPSNKTPLEKSHAPVITAPQTVKSGEPFAVEVSVGEILHPMGQLHWIEFIALDIGNEPAGRIDFQPRGYLSSQGNVHGNLDERIEPPGQSYAYCTSALQSPRLLGRQRRYNGNLTSALGARGKRGQAVYLA